MSYWDKEGIFKFVDIFMEVVEGERVVGVFME
jgi:hypothetical protein